MITSARNIFGNGWESFSLSIKKYATNENTVNLRRILIGTVSFNSSFSKYPSNLSTDENSSPKIIEKKSNTLNFARTIPISALPTTKNKYINLLVGKGSKATKIIKE